MGLYINIGNEGFRAALNGEYSLACVLVLAYYAAQDKFAIVRELPTGKGFADIVLIPRRDVSSPAIVLELKYDHTAQTAINQIKDKHYTDSLLDYVGDVVLVGINYDKRTKQHHCNIERITKNIPYSRQKCPQLEAKVSPAQAEKCPQLEQKNVPSSKVFINVIEQHYSDSTDIQKKKLAIVLSELSKNDLSTSEIMMLLKEQNRTRLRKNIINLLLEKGLIAKIILDKPNHPNQKYKLTEKVRKFISYPQLE